jgi:hypothetical protein
MRRGKTCRHPARSASSRSAGARIEIRRYSGRISWFGGGWKVNADLPTPAGFDSASQFVRPADVAASIACGPDLDEVAEPLLDRLRRR